MTPVTTCPDRGYIAIGTRDLGNVSLVYVIRTDNGGNTIWEKFYDVGADGLPDEGFALTELKHGGWVTTGTSYRGHRLGHPRAPAELRRQGAALEFLLRGEPVHRRLPDGRPRHPRALHRRRHQPPTPSTWRSPATST